MGKISAYIVLLAAMLCAAATRAEESLRPDHPDDDGIFTFSLENDLFSGEDNNYTNGIRIAYLSPENKIPEWLKEGADMLPFLPHGGYKRWQVDFGQSMFTPDDITLKDPPATDRPYAGWLYGSVGLVSDTGTQYDNLQLTIGVVGPASLAAQSQDFIHSLIGSPDPQGWDHQLHNEPGIVLTYERKWRKFYEGKPLGFAMDITPSLGGSIGNVYTHLAAGAVVRMGFDLPADYGPPLIHPNLPGSDFFIPSEDFGWYFFAGLEGRAVARDIFLDGNTFRDSPSVDKNPFVGGLQAGVAFIFGDTRVAYTHVLRTREFEGQPENDAFGAITVSRRF